MLYGLLDQARERSERELANVRARGGAGGTHQARLERDVSAAEHEKRLAQLNLTERGLCFGRTDDDKQNTLYIGRIGLRDDDYELKLIDWRAPAARPFYAATPRNPVGLVRRRHIYTRRRVVTGVDDEVFDLDKLSDKDKSTLSGEAALIAAVSSARTGRMADVVATIQAEQDRVIRADLPGVLVVQGGPGTGKTVAALHRAAYLLYTHRRTLERRGVLVIGPNATFLRYISQVLPSLGETDVVLHTLGDLFPGVHATDTRDPAAVIKGDERMVRVHAAGGPRPAAGAQARHHRRRRRRRHPAGAGRRSCAPATAPAPPASRTTWRASSSSPNCSPSSPGPRPGCSTARSTTKTCPTRAPASGTRPGSTPRSTRSGRCSPRKCCSPTC